MKINHLDTKKYKRFFAFGCSFTDFHWPTWADIIGREIPYYENWGKAGGGNQFIFNSFIECDAKYNFNKDDLVVIMWSSIEREDRYTGSNWLVAPHTQRTRIYGDKWVKQFGNEIRGFLIRDLAVIRAAQQILKTRHCDWANLSVSPISKMDRSTIDVIDLNHLNELHRRYVKLHTDLCLGKLVTEPHAHSPDVLTFYSEVFKNIEDSCLSVVFKGEWNTPPRPAKNDSHPTPNEHLQYLQSIYPTFVPTYDTQNFIQEWENTVWNLKDSEDVNETFKTHKIVRL